MTIIETIKAEIERRMKENQKNATESGSGAFYEDKAILAVLDTIEEQPVNLDIRKELASIEFMGVNDARDSETIARHFANIGWNKGYIKGREDAHKPAREVGLPKRFDKQPVCEELEEEIERYLHSLGVGYGGWVDGMDDDDLRGIARHFYELGRQSKPTTAEGLEEEVEHFCEDMWDDLPPLHIQEAKKVISVVHKCARHFAQWMREKMMKDAVESEVWNYSSNEDLRAIPIWGINKFRDLKDGDKVKLIIVKEDGK